MGAELASLDGRFGMSDMCLFKHVIYFHVLLFVLPRSTGVAMFLVTPADLSKVCSTMQLYASDVPWATFPSPTERPMQSLTSTPALEGRPPLDVRTNELKEPNSDGLQPASNGLQPTSDGLLARLAPCP